MPTPNNSPNSDGGTHSIIRLLWRNRELQLRRDQKPSKDVWDITDLVARAVIALLTVVGVIVIPIVVAKIGGKIQRAVTSQTGKIQESIAVQNTGKDYMQMAFGILEKKDLPEDVAKNLGLRKWAVDLLKYYSPVKLDETTADQLVNGEVEIPLMSDISRNSQDQPWLDAANLNNPLVRRAPHGGPIAFVTTDGVLTVDGLYKVQTQIKSPKALYFSPDGRALIVYNDESLAIYFTTPDTIRGQQHLSSPVRISPPNGISNIFFSEDWKTFFITGKDGKRIQYDFNGDEIK